MVNYAAHVSKKATVQTEKAKPNQVKNSAGGYSFKVDDFKRLQRFLILGSESGTFYASEKKLTRENASCVERCLAEDGHATVQHIVNVSYQGKAVKNDAAIFALALACCAEDVEVRKFAFASIPMVCRTGTHLFQFVENVKELRSFGKGLRQGIASWYNDKNVEQVAFQICKYAQRNGMSHRDVLRLVHPNAATDAHNALYRYIVTGDINGGGERAVYSKDRKNIREYNSVGQLPEFIYKFNELKHADEKRTIQLINQYGFTHEMIDTKHKNSAAVWEALAQKMPLHALLRNLNKMTAVGYLAPFSQGTKLVTSKLKDEVYIRGSRLHPLTILNALRQYSLGRGDKGSLTWNPVPTVVQALDSAFYKSFDYVKPSNKNFLLGVDVSGSMSIQIPGSNLTSCEVVGCIALAIAKHEPNYHIHGFAGNFVDLGINASMNLGQVKKKIQIANFGSTDCSLPFLYAKSMKLDVDCFIVLTDCETYAGSVHPFQAIKQYRSVMNKPEARSVVLATTATRFSIADPSDPLMLDIPGFSTDVPKVISEFASGSF